MNGVQGAERQTIYQIKVKGRLDKRWSEWFSDMTIEIESDNPPITTLTGMVVDQAALRGIISRLWDLDMTVVAVNSVTEMPQTASTRENNGG